MLVAVPNGLKDFIELCDSVGVMLGLVGSAAAAIRWYITREQRQAAGRVAVEQVHKMATNDLPHLFEESLKTNDHLGEQTKILASVDRNIGLLVDRGNRGSRQSDH